MFPEVVQGRRRWRARRRVLGFLDGNGTLGGKEEVCSRDSPAEDREFPDLISKLSGQVSKVGKRPRRAVGSHDIDTGQVCYSFELGLGSE